MHSLLTKLIQSGQVALNFAESINFVVFLLLLACLHHFSLFFHELADFVTLIKHVFLSDALKPMRLLISVCDNRLLLLLLVLDRF